MKERECRRAILVRSQRKNLDRRSWWGRGEPLIFIDVFGLTELLQREVSLRVSCHMACRYLVREHLSASKG